MTHPIHQHISGVRNLISIIMSALPQGSTPSTSSFTCNTCAVKFVTADLQRQHMKTDWHRYNLKRRVAQLPSISSDVFAEKVLEQQKAQEEQQLDEDEYGFHINHRRRSKNGPQLTKKLMKQQLNRGRLLQEQDVPARVDSPVSVRSAQFSLGHSESEFETNSELNYTDMSASEVDAHSDILVVDEEVAEDSDIDEMDDLDELLTSTHCVFCGINNHEMEVNVRHMFSKHGLYIPERLFLVDLESLLAYISEHIVVQKVCMVCGFQGKNLESIRQHVHSKGHCKIPYETREERMLLAPFYDFSLSEEQESVEQTESKVTFDDSPVEVSVDDVNSNYSTVQVDPTGVELTLPTGSRIGHRTMMRYYRQNIPETRELAEPQKTLAVADRRYASGVTAREVVKQEKQVQLLEQKQRNHYERRTKALRVNHQPHFRDEILGTLGNGK